MLCDTVELARVQEVDWTIKVKGRRYITPTHNGTRMIAWSQDTTGNFGR